jgi:hypothetical protein
MHCEAELWLVANLVASVSIRLPLIVSFTSLTFEPCSVYFYLLLGISIYTYKSLAACDRKTYGTIMRAA